MTTGLRARVEGEAVAVVEVECPFEIAGVALLAGEHAEVKKLLCAESAGCVLS